MTHNKLPRTSNNQQPTNHKAYARHAKMITNNKQHTRINHTKIPYNEQQTHTSNNKQQNTQPTPTNTQQTSHNS